MDCRTGEILRANALEASQFEQVNNRKLLPLSNTQAQALEKESPTHRKNNMRNQKCVCGSGIKFKRCCWGKYA